MPVSEQISPSLSLQQISHLSLLVPPPSSLLLDPTSRLLTSSSASPSVPAPTATVPPRARFPLRRSSPPRSTPGISLATFTLLSDPEADLSCLLAHFSPKRVVISHQDAGGQQQVGRELQVHLPAASGPKAEKLAKVIRSWSVGRRLEEIRLEGARLVASKGGSLELGHWVSRARQLSPVKRSAR